MCAKRLVFQIFNVMFLLSFVTAENLNAHVPEGQGQTLQFYSGWCTTPPVINANVTDAVNPPGSAISGTTPDEWDDAFCRSMTLKRSDGTSDTLPGYIYLMNDANFLYIGLVYYHDNSGNLNRISFYFDEGIGGGSHDDTLTANNENAVSSNRVSTGWDPWDRYWDGTGWLNEAVINFDVYEGYYSDRFQWECKVPLTLGGEDLLVNGGDGINPGDEIGFLLQIVRNGGVNPGDYYYDQTNQDPNDASIAPGWMDIRLGRTKKFMTFAATKNVNGTPTVNGSIAEDAWRGCYQRNIVLTNFAGDVMNAMIYGVYNSTTSNVYMGVKVFDITNDAGDYCQLYQEQAFPGPTSGRDFLLNDNQENAIKIEGATSTDRYWANLTRTWDTDLEGADGQVGAGSYNSNHWEYEAVLNQNLGQYDLDGVNNNANLGFLLRYHDGSAGEDFYWDASVNVDHEYIDQSSNTSIAVGWPYLQLGAPYLQIIHPEDGLTVEGTYPIDVYAEAVDPATIDSVQYQIEGDVTWTHLVRVNSTYYWAGNWETTSKSDGTYEFRVRAIDSDGRETVQIINVIINNTGGVSDDIPVVTITAPVDGDIISGIIPIQWTSVPQGAALLISADSVEIDGGAWIRATTQPPTTGGAGSYNWNTAADADGSHIFKIKTIDSNGKVGYSPNRLVIIDNTGPKIEDITFNYPSGQKAAKVGDTITVTAYVTDNISGVNSVILNGTNLNGVAVNTMSDNGVSPDETANDNVYTTRIIITNSTTGTVAYNVNAADNEGNTGNVARSAILDNAAPVALTIRVLDPDNIYKNGESVALRCSTDAKGYKVSCNFLPIDNGYVSNAENVQDNGDGTYDVSYTITTGNTRPDSQYTITAAAVDSVGLSGTGTVNLRLDNSKSNVTALDFIIDPQNDSILNSSDTLIGSAQDSSGIILAEYFVDIIGDYGTGTAMSGAFGTQIVAIKAFFPINDLSEGKHTVYVRAQDSTGIWGSCTAMNFIVDTAPPDIENLIVEYPSGQDEVRNGQDVIISALITDATTRVNSDSVWIDGTNLNSDSFNLMYDDGTNGDKVSGDHIYTAVITVSTGSNGSQNFTVYAYDIVPNGTSKTAGVIMDNTLPAWIANTCGDADDIYKNTDKITIVTKWNGTDYRITADFTNIDSDYKTGAENIVNNGDSTYTITYDIGYGNTASDAINKMIPITAYDAVDNGPVTDSSYVIELDNTPPYFYSVDAERDNYADGDTLRITCFMNDTTYSLKYDLSCIDSDYREGEEIVSRQDTVYTITYVISNDSINTIPDGSYDISIYALDIAGNEENQSTSVELDNTPEPVTILQPSAGEILKGDVTIDVTAPDDAGFVCFQISPDNGTNWYNLNGTRTPDTCTIDANGTDGWRQVWHTNQDSLGDATAYLIKVYAYDEMNPVPHLIATDFLGGTIVIDNSAPELKLAVYPLPQKGDSLNGEVYVNEVILKGVHTDSISGIEKTIIEVKNDGGDDINNSPIIIPPQDSTFSRCIKLVNGNNHIKVTVFDNANNIVSGTALLDYIIPEICEEIGSEGGTIEAPDGTKLIIPQGALLQNTRICIRPVPDDELVPPTESSKLRMLKVAHDFTPDGLVFHKPVTMILPYTEADLNPDQDNEAEYEEDSLSVFFFDGSEWLKVSEPERDLADNYVTVKINHFTVFDIGVDSKTIPAKTNVFWTKNPFKSTDGTSICFELPEAGKVTLKIYDLAGDVVATITENQDFTAGDNSLRWNGKTDFDKYVGSGIYVYVLEYKSESKTKDMIEKKPLGVIK